MIFRFRTLSLAVLLLATVMPQVLLGADALPAGSLWPVRPLAEVEGFRALDIDRTSLAREDLEREEQGLPYRFAQVQEVSLTPDAAGTWEDLPSGRSLWRLRITGPDVLSLNFGFTRFWLPHQARLLIYSPTGEGPVLAFDETDNAAHGELWTQVLITDDVVVELEVDPALRWQVELELTAIGRGYRFFGEDLEEKSGPCNIDVVCPEGDDWRNEIATVALFTSNAGKLCTGYMTNNTAEDGTPYFMTAYHCGVRAGAAPSVVVYWNFESPECGQQGGGTRTDTQNGSVLRAEYETTDVTLLELDDLPDSAFNVRYAGWDRTSGVASSAVCIHHPSTDEKSISFENDPLSVTSYQGVGSPGDGTHLRVIDWDAGTTEGGSSGSPLFDQDHHVVGQLHGGAAACGNNESDWYGRFFVSWAGGGTSDSRLSDWLDPLGTGAATVETIDPFFTSFAVEPGTGLESYGVIGGPFEPVEIVYTLTNTGDRVAAFSAAVSEPWLTATPGAGSIPVGGTVQVTVALTAAAADLGVGRHQTTLQIGNTDNGAGTTSRPVTLAVVANVPRLIGAVPNPFGNGSVPVTEIRYTLGNDATVRARIHDIRGGMVKDLGSMAGVAGENHFLWDGTGQGGARLASGTYVFVLEALGREERTSIMLVH
ncbi:MAG: trypsin-like peptidase domain-containing protein [Candidatus Krumholzibacteriota bacterium]